MIQNYEKLTQRNILTVENIWQTCPTEQIQPLFITKCEYKERESHLFICILSLAVFLLHCQSF